MAESLEALRDVDFALGIDDDDAGIGIGLYERDAALGSEDEHRIIESIGGGGILGIDRDRPCAACGLAGAWIEDVVVTGSLANEGSFVVTSGGKGVVFDFAHRKVVARVEACLLYTSRCV